MKFSKALKGGFLLALLIALTTATFQVFTNTVFDPELAMEDEMLDTSELPKEDEQLMNALHRNQVLYEGEQEGFEITYDDLTVTQDSLTMRTTNPPPQPDIVYSSIDRVTVQTIPAPAGWVTEYRIRDTSRSWGFRWQTSNSFDRLTEGVTYQVQARFRATTSATHEDSDESVTSEDITLSNDIILRPFADLPIHTEVRAFVREGVEGRVSITATNTADVPVNLTLGSISSGNPDPVLLDAAGNQIAFRNSTNLPPALNPMNFSYTITLNPGQSWNGFVGTDGDLASLYPSFDFIPISVGWTRAQQGPPPCPTRLTTEPPSQPVLSNLAARGIVVYSIPAPNGWATEYRIREGNGSWGPWQDSNTFNGLIRGTVYQVQARFRAIDPVTHADSAESEASADITFAPGVSAPPQPVLAGTQHHRIAIEPIPAPDGWVTTYRIRAVNGSWSNWRTRTVFERFDGVTPGEIFQVQARFSEDPIVNYYFFSPESELSVFMTPSPDSTRATHTGNTITVDAIAAPSGWTIEYRISTIWPTSWSEWQTGTSFEVVAGATRHQIEARFVADNSVTHVDSSPSLVALTIQR